MFLITSLILLSLSYRLFKYSAGTLSLTQPNMISWIFYYSFIIQSFIASLLVVYNLDNHYLVSKITFESSRLYGWLAVQYALVATPLGMCFIMMITGRGNNATQFQTYCKQAIQYSITSNDKTIRACLYLLSCLSIAAIAYVIYLSPNIPIFKIFSNASTEALLRARIETAREFPGNEYVKNLFAILLTPILSYALYGYAKLTKAKIDVFFSYTMIVMSCFIMVYDFAKAPIIMYFLSFCFLKVLMGYKFKVKKLIKISLLTTLLILIGYTATNKDFSIYNIFSYNTGPIGRIILSQAAGTYLSFDVFPYYYEHLGFSSISNAISNILDFSYQERSAKILMSHYNHDAVSAGTAGVINSLFIAEAWANFGFMGIILVPILVGMVVQTIYQTSITGKKTPLKLAFYAYFSVALPITGGTNDFFYNITALFVVIILLFIYLTALFYKQKNNFHGQ